MNGTQLLDDYWKKSGKKKLYLHKKMGVSRPRLDYIFSHPDTATVFQADTLCKELNISKEDKMYIFLPEM